MRLLLPFLILLLAACSAPPPPADPAAASERWGLAEYLIIRHQYPEAVTEIREAIRLDPGAGLYRLWLGDVLEAQDAHAEAFSVFTGALQELPADSPYRDELTYRAGLLAGVRLDAAGDARKLLEELPPESPRHQDLMAALDLAAGRPRQALEKLNAALAEGLEPDLAARILYHAALAYRELGSEEAAMAAIYKAVSLARRPAVIQDIADLFYDLRGTELSWPDAPPSQGGSP